MKTKNSAKRNFIRWMVSVFVVALSFTASAQPNVWIIANPDTGCSPLVQFSDSTAPGVVINTWLWDLGDGSTASSPSLTHQYSNPGSYLVTLITQDSTFAFDTVFANILIHPTPVINLTKTDISCYGLTDGSIIANVTSGSPPYSYLWSNGSTTATISNLGAGTYTITVVDGNGCPAFSNAAVIQPQPILVFDSTFNATCSNSNNGSINLSVTGGSAPYSFIWNTGNNSEDIFGLPPGNYSVTITDNLNCSVALTSTVSTLSNMQDTIDVIANISCFGNSDGALLVSVQGGIQPYTFSWSNGATTQAIPNLSAGTYSVTITDAAGCTITSSANLINPNANLVTLNFTDTFLCTTDTIDLFASAGFTSYLWTNSSTAQTQTISYNGNAFTTWTVFATDANGCTTSDSALVEFDSDCVWPGDANSDGITNNLDILYMGLTHGFPGPARQNASLVWADQPARPWSGSFVNGTNHKHTDTNGDGIVDDSDTLAVSLNYNLIHAKMPGFNCGQHPPLYVDLPDTLYTGQRVDAPIMLGRVSTQVFNLYGIAFTINYDTGIIDTNTALVRYTSSWMGTHGNDLLGFHRDWYFDAQTNVAFTRNDRVSIAQNYGQIGTFSFTIKDDVSGKRNPVATLNITTSSITAFDYNEDKVIICGESDSSVISDGVSGIRKNEMQSLKVYPNPAQDKLYFSYEKRLDKISLHDVMGRMIIEQYPDSSNYEMDLSELPGGMYFVRVESNNKFQFHQIVIQ